MSFYFHPHKIHLLKNKLYEIYLHSSIQGFALSLISIFIPIYLLKLGYSLNQVIIFYIFYFISIAIFSFFSAMLSTKVGLKHTILLRIPLTVIFLLGLYLLPTLKLPINLIAILGGFESILYWIPIHSLFARYSDKEHRAAEVSKWTSFPKIASMAGPLIGAFIAITLGFSILFIITITILLLSVIPLFFTKEIKPHVEFSIKRMSIFFKKDLKFFGGVAANSARGLVDSLFWPIFVFLILKTIWSVGLVGALVSISSIWFILFIGKVSDRVNKKNILKIGGLLLAIVWFLRIFAFDSLFIYSLTVAAGFFAVLIHIPFSAITYNKINKHKKFRDEFIVFREIPVAIGRLTLLLIVLVVTSKFIVSFSLAILTSLFFILY